MVTVNKATVIENIWTNFYNRIVSQVTSVSISISPSTVTVQNYLAAYNDKIFSTKSNYPIVIVNDPEILDESVTFRDASYSGTIEIDIYTMQAEAASKFLSDINTAIETFSDDFASVGLHKVELDDTSNDREINGQIKSHIRTATFRFTYDYTRTA